MHYRRLGKTGLKISEISLGTWVTMGNQIEDDRSLEIMRNAYELGINFFDNADIIANGKAEEILNHLIMEVGREGLIISSKVFWPTFPGPNGRGLSRKHITESINASLKRLGTDYVDLYYCHRYDQDTPIEEVVYSMDNLIRQGKILYWGTSEWKPWQITSAIMTARQHNLIPPAMEQPQYNMFHRRRLETELYPLHKEFGVGLTTWSPLYYGVLTGKYARGIPEGSRAAMESMAWILDRITPQRVAIVDQLVKLSEELGITTAQLAIAWLLRRKELSCVITGATSVDQLKENIGAAEIMDKLTENVLDQIDKILNNTPDEG